MLSVSHACLSTFLFPFPSHAGMLMPATCYSYAGMPCMACHSVSKHMGHSAMLHNSHSNSAYFYRHACYSCMACSRPCHTQLQPHTRSLILFAHRLPPACYMPRYVALTAKVPNASAGTCCHALSQGGRRPAGCLLFSCCLPHAKVLPCHGA